MSGRLPSLSIAAALALTLVTAACGSNGPPATSAPSPTNLEPTAASASPASTPTPTADLPSFANSGPVSSNVTAFFYAWYGTKSADGKWIHWNQLQHSPPDDIASSFYPARGPYSSADLDTMSRQMAELSAARVGVIAVSWWGQGSMEEPLLPPLFAAAAAAGIRIAFHIEPYQGQTAASVASDIHYLLSRYGGKPALYRVARSTSGDASTAARAVFYVFASSRLPVADLRTAISGLRGTPDDAIVLVHSPKAVSATRVGADGVYTYDALADPASFAGLVADCKSANLICSPSAAPGFDNTHAVATGQMVIDRAGGARYDAMWQAALAAHAEWVSVTTFNEWHEGTQIEPARPYSAAGRTYESYDGAYGETGDAAQTAYLERTAYWVGQLTP